MTRTYATLPSVANAMNAATRPDLRYMSRQLVQFYRKQGKHGFLEARFACTEDGKMFGSLGGYTVVIEFFTWDECEKSAVAMPPGTEMDRAVDAKIAALSRVRKDDMVLVKIKNYELLFIWSDMCDSLPPLDDKDMLCEYANLAFLDDADKDTGDISWFCAFVGTRELCTACGGRAVASCSTCHKARYCCSECQSTHWAEHKVACAPLKFGNDEKKTRDIATSLGQYVLKDGLIWVHRGTKADAFLIDTGKRTRRIYFDADAPATVWSAKQSSKNASGKGNRKDRVKK